LQGLKEPLDVPVLALTATATRRVALDILRQLGMRKPAGFKGSFFRPNLQIATRKKGQGGNTRAELLALIRAHDGESGIVYCQSRKGVDQTAEFLSAQGIRALPYHAGLEPDVRARNQEAFQRDDIDVIVATVDAETGALTGTSPALAPPYIIASMAWDAALGLLIVFYPASAAVSIIWVIAGTAVLVGLVLLAFGWKLKSAAQDFMKARGA
jgi:hypothetical protein